MDIATSPTSSDLSETFPRLEDWYVRRESILDNIDFHLRNGVDVLLLDGEEGYGKTVTLAQFCLTLAGRCVSTFARRDDKLLGHPAVLRADLFRQVKRLIQAGDNLTDTADEAVWRSALTALRRVARARREPIIFIIDGLNSFTDKDAIALNEILALYPIGTPDFQFVIATTGGYPAFEVPRDVQIRELPISILQPVEAKQILEPFSLNEEQLHTIRTLCNGSPGKLASVRRRLTNGDSIAEILAESPASDKSFYAGEWKKVSAADKSTKLILAILAADDRPRSLEEIAGLANVDTAHAEQGLRKLSFIRLDRGAGTIEYQTDSFRRFAAEKLRDVMPEALDILIRELRSVPRSELTLTQLPQLLERRDDREGVVALLSPEYFAAITSISQSLAPVRDVATIGAKAARRENRDSDLLRFGLYQATINALSGDAPRRSEVEAHLALGDMDRALFVAQSAGKIEERFELLALVARHRRDKGLPPDTALLTDIKALSEKADVSLLGNRSTQLAADLFSVDPALAISVVERSTSPQASQSMREWSLVRMTLESMKKSREPALGAYETVYERITDPEVKKFVQLISTILSDHAAPQVLSFTSNMGWREQLTVLQEWLKLNDKREDAIDVAEHALSLAVATREFTLTFAFLRDLANALRSASDRERADKFASLIQDHASASADRGSNVELVELRLKLAEYRLRRDYGKGADEYLEIFIFVDTIQDLFSRAIADARMLRSLAMTEQSTQLEADVQLRWQVSQRLRKTVEELLATSADHYRALSPIVVALAEADATLAEMLASDVNTSLRRELCIRDLCVWLVKEARSPAFKTVARLLSQIRFGHIKDDVRMAVFQRLRRNPREGANQVDEIEHFLTEMPSILSSEARCVAAAIGLVAVSHFENAARANIARERCRDALRKSWDSIDELWRRIGVGYSVVSILAQSCTDDARQLMSVIEGLRATTSLTSSVAASVVINETHLATRAFAGVVEQGLEGEIEAAESALGSLIARIPANGIQSQLWSAIALHYFRLGRDADGRRIVDRHVRPLYEAISNIDRAYRRDTLIAIAPALFSAHQDLALEEIARIDAPHDDYILQGLAGFLIRGVPDSEPHSNRRGRGKELTVGALADICKLLERTKLDWVIWSNLGLLARSLGTAKNKDELTLEERTQLASRIRALVDRLPLVDCIQHDGPSVVATSFALKIERARAQAWKPLIDRAAKIPNSADRALVRFTVAESLPPSGSVEREQLLADAIQDVHAIGSLPDRADHLVALAEAFSAADHAAPLLREAFECSHNASAEQAQRIQRRVLDAAYRLDEDLASKLVAELDKDPKRAEVRRLARRRINVLATNKRLVDVRQHASPKLTITESNEAAYMGASLNSRLRRPVRPNDFARAILFDAGTAPLLKSYWVFAWIVENLVHRQDRSEHARNVVHATFFATVQAAELASAVVRQTAAEHLTSRALISEMPQGVVVGSREREEALGFLRDWLPKQHSESIIVCDPWLGPDDLDLIELIHWCNPDAQIVLLTSWEPHARLEGQLSEVYRRAWKDVSDQEAPHCEITLVFEEQPPHKCPIHDRWILLERCGLKIGPSAAGIGVGRIGSLDPIGAADAAIALSTIGPFLSRTARSYNGKRIDYRAFSLRGSQGI